MGGSYYPIPCSILSTGKDRKTPQRYPDVSTTSWRISIRSMDSRTIDQSAGGKLRDRNAEESWALLEDLALYDNESWNDPRDFTKPVKAITLPQDVPSISDRRLIEIENQVQHLMEAHLASTQPTQVNKITTSCEIYSGPHDTQYCMEDPEQAFVEYASSRIDEAGGKWYTLKPEQNTPGDTYNPSWRSHPNLRWRQPQNSQNNFSNPPNPFQPNGSIPNRSFNNRPQNFNNQSNLEGLVSDFMASQDARLSKFESDFKQQQSEMIDKIDIVYGYSSVSRFDVFFRNQLLVFQHQDESLYDSWTRFKDIIQKVPNHGLSIWNLIEIFLKHLDSLSCHIINLTVEGDLKKFSDIGAWYAIEDCAQYDKKCSNPTSTIFDETIANPNAQIVGDDMVSVQVPRCIAWLDYDEHVDSLSTMDNKVGVTSPESTTQTLPSFKEYTPPMTYPKEVEKTLGTPIEIESLNETKLKEVGLKCNHNTPLSSREVPSFDGPEPQPLLNSPSLDVSLGDVMGPKLPIKPHSLNSSRMKLVDYLTTQTPPSPHEENSHPKCVYSYYNPCIDDPKRHYGIRSSLLGKSVSLGVDISNWEMFDDD
ncbi:hypothetical protein Tco_0644239 [Tanacetum coccineum]